ncbi:MAG: NUDIX domain-containing protein [Flavobacteriaceae bacterium]|nr:NUDIX domain-containing protein [Flavobacteriaceae bacterium]
MSKRFKNIVKKILSERKFTLYEVNFDYEMTSGNWVEKNREVFDCGNGATILLYNPKKGTIILNKQFRIASKINGNETGFLLETPAGKIEEGESPADCIVRETKEETGIKVKDLKPILNCFTSPGSVTERIYFFVAEYSEEDKVNEGGGKDSENEDIQVLEIDFNEAVAKIESGEIIDAKTIMLIQYAQINNLL